MPGVQTWQTDRRRRVGIAAPSNWRPRLPLQIQADFRPAAVLGLSSEDGFETDPDCRRNGGSASLPLSQGWVGL